MIAQETAPASNKKRLDEHELAGLPSGHLRMAPIAAILPTSSRRNCGKMGRTCAGRADTLNARRGAGTSPRSAPRFSGLAQAAQTNHCFEMLDIVTIARRGGSNPPTDVRMARMLRLLAQSQLDEPRLPDQLRCGFRLGATAGRQVLGEPPHATPRGAAC